jgi:hypothetical protein
MKALLAQQRLAQCIARITLAMLHGATPICFFILNKHKYDYSFLLFLVFICFFGVFGCLFIQKP